MLEYEILHVKIAITNECLEEYSQNNKQRKEKTAYSWAKKDEKHNIENSFRLSALKVMRSSVVPWWKINREIILFPFFKLN